MRPDFQVMGGGSVYLLRPVSNAAQSWVDDNLSEERMAFGDGIVVEHRYITDIVTGIINDGLTVTTH